MRRLSIALAVVCLAADLPAAAGEAVQPPNATSRPLVYRLKVGDIPVSALSDGTVPLDLHTLLRGISVAELDRRLSDAGALNPLPVSINAFLVELPGHKVLVDTGAGDLLGAGVGGNLPAALAAAGATPSEITDVLITHTHVDHIGGLVRNGQLTFPNATVHIAKADIDFFLDASNAARTGYNIQFFEVAKAILDPVIKAGKLKPFATSGQVVPGITAELHPGHTPGLTFYTLISHRKRLVFVGDVVHVQPVQFPRPDVTITFDQDPTRARAVREQSFEAFARNRTEIAVPHLPFPGIGHVFRSGDGYRWLPLQAPARQKATR